jgi:hypothetical protein
MRKAKKKSDAMRLLEKLSGGPLTLARAIESVRKSEGLSQDECAKKLGVSKSHLGKGRRSRNKVSEGHRGRSSVRSGACQQASYSAEAARFEKRHRCSC